MNSEDKSCQLYIIIRITPFIMSACVRLIPRTRLRETIMKECTSVVIILIRNCSTLKVLNTIDLSLACKFDFVFSESWF